MTNTFPKPLFVHTSETHHYYYHTPGDTREITPLTNCWWVEQTHSANVCALEVNMLQHLTYIYNLSTAIPGLVHILQQLTYVLKLYHVLSQDK